MPFQQHLNIRDSTRIDSFAAKFAAGRARLAEGQVVGGGRHGLHAVTN